MANEKLLGSVLEDSVDDLDFLIDLSDVLGALVTRNRYLSVPICDEFAPLIEPKELVVDVFEHVLLKAG